MLQNYWDKKLSPGHRRVLLKKTITFKTYIREKLPILFSAKQKELPHLVG